MTTFMPIVRDVLAFLIWFGVPVLMFLPWVKKRADMGQRMIISTLLVWFGLFLHCVFIHVPVGMALADARGKLDYDGAGYSVGIVMFGWVFGIIGTTVAACADLAIQYLRRKLREQRTS